jgi:hypothetical protein
VQAIGLANSDIVVRNMILDNMRVERGGATKRRLAPAIAATALASSTLYGRSDTRMALAAARRTMISSSLFKARTIGSKIEVSLTIVNEVDWDTLVAHSSSAMITMNSAQTDKQQHNRLQKQRLLRGQEPLGDSKEKGRAE